jgi:hypothetical protein
MVWNSVVSILVGFVFRFYALPTINMLGFPQQEMAEFVDEY